MAAGSIVISLLMATGSFETSTDRAEKRLKKFKKEAEDVGKKVGLAFAAIGTAAGALIKSQIDLADELGKMSAKAGVSTEALSALSYAANLSGSSQQELTDSLVKLSRQMQDAAGGSATAGEAFKAIGVSVTDASGRMRSADEVFKEISTRFASMPDGVEKSAAAVDLFGRSGANLIPLLNSGALGLKQMEEEARRLGVVIGGDTANAAANFNDNLSRLRATFDGITIALASDVLPWLNKLTDELLVGLQNTNGLIDAIFTLGTINPFRDQAENLKAYREEMQELQAARDRYLRSNADTRAIDEAINNLQKKINYLAQLENRRLLSNVEFSPDDQSSAEARRLGLRPATRVPTPPRTPDPVRTLRSALPALEKPALMTFAGLSAADELIASELELFEAVRATTAANEERLKSFIDSTPSAVFKQQQNDIEFLQQALEKNAISLDEYAEIIRTKFGDTGKAVKEVASITQELGLTFASAFEDAIVNGKKLSDVFKGLGDDILRITTRKLVTEPLGDLISGAVKGSGFLSSIGSSISSFFGGFKALGGDVLSGRSYVVGEQGPELFVPRTAGAIVPNAALAGGGKAVTVNNTFMVPAPTERRTQNQIAVAAARALQSAQRNM